MKKYKIIFNSKYIQDMIEIKEKHERGYYVKLKESSNKKIKYLEYMPRMYQQIWLDNNKISR